MNINTEKVNKRVYSQANENLKFDSSPDKLHEQIYYNLALAGYLADSIAETPLRQIIDACVVSSKNALSHFDKERFETDEDYATKWYNTNKQFQDKVAELISFFRNI